MNPNNTNNFGMTQFCAQQIQNLFNLQAFPFAPIEILTVVVPVPQGLCPLAVGWYEAVFNAQITELRLGNMCATDRGSGVANYFGMRFTFQQRSYHFWVVDSGVHSALPPPANLRPKVGPMEVCTATPFLLLQRALAAGAQPIGIPAILHTGVLIRIRDPFGIVWIIKSINFRPLLLAGGNVVIIQNL